MPRIEQCIFETMIAEKDRLFQYASYRLHNIMDVEDVLQNTYFKILDCPNRFKKVKNKRAYIYRIISNECSELLKNDAKMNYINDVSLEISSIPDLQPENYEEEFVLINRLLTLLPSEQSEALRLRHHSNLSFQDIADVMEVPLPTAKARYRYGLEKIRSELKKLNLL